MRTNHIQVTFQRPFSLTGVDSVQPAGTYTVETDEEPIQELSFVAYRRVCTRINLAADPSKPGHSETVVVDSKEFDAALANDMASDPTAHEGTNIP